MAENDQLDFNEGLAEVYKGFGIFGFSQIVREKEKQIDKQSNYILWKEVKALFLWPHVLLTALVFITFFTVSRFVPLIYISPIMVVAVLFFYIFSMRKLKVINKNKRLRMMIYYPPGMAFIYFYLQLLVHLTLIDPLMFAAGSSLTVVLLLAHVRFNKKLKSRAMHLYPAAFVAQ